MGRGMEYKMVKREGGGEREAADDRFLKSVYCIGRFLYGMYIKEINTF